MPITMPAGTTSAVCITFDFDTIALWLGSFDTFDSQGLTRGEYGARVGAERVLELLARYDVRSTWFVPGLTAESWPGVTRAVAAAGHEIAHHGYGHESPPTTGEREEELLLRGVEALERVTGKRPIGYRAPSWTITERTVPLLLEHGFLYGANGMAEDFRPYRARIGDRVSRESPLELGEETDLIEIPSAWHLTDIAMLEVGVRSQLASSPAEAERIWRDEFDYMHTHVEGGVITYVFHPQCIARGHRIVIFERLLAHMRDAGGVWFARTEDVARAWTPDPPGLWAERN
jgi:peptidoglycan/xylan/chitin deacetylase (PgdA/CDA1 family)